jgi:V-type H+-transporting ATPase subunit a
MSRDKVHSFELMLWRLCRGNVFLKTADIEEYIEDSQSRELESKTVFIIFFQGEQLKSKCKKICDGFKAIIYPCPETPQERRDMLNGVSARLDELKTVLDQSLHLRKTLLVNASHMLKTWHCKVKKMKGIYHVLNMFKFDQKSMIAQCWIPKSEIARIQTVLDQETKKIDPNFRTILNLLSTHQEPPTFHRTNKFTAAFQQIINAYGIPNYREINPTPFTVITFPFLFAVMFGDLGHGLLVLAAAAFMVRKEATLKKTTKGNEIMEIFFGGRYIILLMGLFSLYCGLIYNDIFSKSMNIFGSSWRVNLPNNFTYEKITSLYLNPDPLTLNKEPQMYSGSPYVFGLDPVRYMS